MRSKANIPLKFARYLTRNGHARSWPWGSIGRELAIYVCKNSPSISEKTSKFLCEFLTSSAYADVSFAREVINILLKKKGRYGRFQIHKSFYEWILRYHNVLFVDDKALKDKVVKHIKDRHPRLLDEPIQSWSNSNGDLHRIEGPAAIYFDQEEWWRDGQCHREDGPAVIQADGSEWYYLNDVLYTKAQFYTIIKSRKTVETDAILQNEAPSNIPTKPLTGKTYAITGTLPITRARATEVIQNAGGKYSSSLNRDVILIVGEPTSGTTVKQRTAKRYKNQTIKWDDLIREITPPPAAAEPEKSTHPTFQSVMDWLLSDKNNIHKTLEAIELVDVKANCEQF